MKKYFWFVECVMLFACLAFGGCTEEGDAISTLGASEKKHVGYWTMGDKAHGVDGADIDRFAFLDIPVVAQLQLFSTSPWLHNCIWAAVTTNGWQASAQCSLSVCPTTTIT